MTEKIQSLQLVLDREKLSLDERRASYQKHKDKLDPLIEELDKFGADISYPNSIDIRIVGDKTKFLGLLRLLARHGFKPPKVEKGATGFSAFVYSDQFAGLQFWCVFSSTVCRRVKVGIKMVEQDVYETVCDEIYPHGEEEAAA